MTTGAFAMTAPPAQDLALAGMAFLAAFALVKHVRLRLRARHAAGAGDPAP